MTTDPRNEFTTALRQLADFFDQHPDLPVPDTSLNFDYFYWGADGAKHIGSIARLLKPFKKNYSTDYLRLIRTFGPLQLTYWFGRTSVCEMKQVGTKKEVRKVAKEYVDQEVEVPVYEYNCPPLLGLDVEDKND